MVIQLSHHPVCECVAYTIKRLCTIMESRTRSWKKASLHSEFERPGTLATCMRRHQRPEHGRVCTLSLLHILPLPGASVYVSPIPPCLLVLPPPTSVQVSPIPPCRLTFPPPTSVQVLSIPPCLFPTSTTGMSRAACRWARGRVLRPEERRGLGGGRGVSE